MSEFFQKWQRSSFVFLKDLHLLASLRLAQFMVWRFLRRRRKENAARRKSFRLVHGRACGKQAESYGVSRVDWLPEVVVSNARAVYRSGNEGD